MVMLTDGGRAVAYRIRVCTCCGQPFERPDDEDRDRCNGCCATITRAADERQWSLRSHLKREYRPRWLEREPDADER